MGSRSSGCSWRSLAQLRRRGQVPAGPIWVTDHAAQRWHFEEVGGFAVCPPEPDEAHLVAGLEVLMIADRNEQTTTAAQAIAGSNPRRFVAYWRGEGCQVVIG